MDPPEEQPFRFLDLPREMRDNVYDLLIIGNEITFHEPEDALPVVGQNYLPTNALLVNRQINKEIRRRGDLYLYTPTLSLTDHSEFGFDYAPSLIIPSQTELINVRIFAVCRDHDCQHRDVDALCEVALCILEHLDWIQKWLFSAPELRNFAIEAQIYLGAETNTGDFQPELIEETQAPFPLADFSQLPALRKIQVYAGTDTSRNLSCFAKKNYFTTWTSENGWGPQQDAKVTDDATNFAEP